MKLTHAIAFMLVLAVIVTGCTGVTGNAARPPPPAPSGGGCGVAAPVDTQDWNSAVPVDTAVSAL